eukprot:6470229-Pyramimonas_sp.AAC.1
MMRHVLSLVEHPWVTCAQATHTRQDRRGSRARPPSPSGVDLLYISDGASRGQGRAVRETASSFGAVRMVGDLVVCSIAQTLDTFSKNVAEYQGCSLAFKTLSAGGSSGSSSRSTP